MQKFHKENQYKEFISKENLIDESGFSGDWLSFVLNSMSSNIVNLKGGYALKNHSLSLSDSDLKLIAKLEELLIRAGYDLPKIENLYSDDPKKALSLLHVLKNKEKVVEIKQGLWIHTTLLDKLKHELSKYFSSSKQMKVSDFKQFTLSSRKSAIPLLEYCDKQSFTIRKGDVRIKGGEIE